MKLATKKKIWLLRQLCNLNTLWGVILQQKLQRFQLLITNFTNQRQYFTAFSKNAKDHYQKLGSK